ncbi:hypothetical protein [Candidatus Electrothrix sp.]|uniref:hypothetical protein n=1 Tax=Candidatus Electrothrix sp. TaxID=2170559 RepID=UPI00405774D2
MNKAAITKQKIYNKLVGFTEQDLVDVSEYIDFVRYRRGIGEKKVVRLEGLLKNYDIDLSDLKAFRKETWQHVDLESDNG